MEIRDGNWTLREHDAATGRTVWSYYDGERMHIRTDYPVATTIEQNKAAYSSHAGGWAADWHHVASIPNNVHYDSGLHESIRQGDRKFTKRWLNDSDNRAWRVRGGNV